VLPPPEPESRGECDQNHAYTDPNTCSYCWSVILAL
jgi:hypothetical protein